METILITMFVALMAGMLITALVMLDYIVSEGLKKVATAIERLVEQIDEATKSV